MTDTKPKGKIVRLDPPRSMGGPLAAGQNLRGESLDTSTLSDLIARQLVEVLRSTRKPPAANLAGVASDSPSPEPSNRGKIVLVPKHLVQHMGKLAFRTSGEGGKMATKFAGILRPHLERLAQQGQNTQHESGQVDPREIKKQLETIVSEYDKHIDEMHRYIDAMNRGSDAAASQLGQLAGGFRRARLKISARRW